MMRNFKVGVLVAIFTFCFNNIYAQEFLRLEKLNERINSSNFDESGPVLSLDGMRLFFTRTGYPDFNRTLIENGEDLSNSLSAENFNSRLNFIYQSLGGQSLMDPSKSNLNQDIWFADITDTANVKVIHPPYPTNSALPNSIVSTGLDTGVYLTINQFYKDGSMYAGFSTVNELKGGQFSFPEPLHIYDFKLKSGDVNLSMSYDGDIIILSMNRYDAIGKNDLYVCFRVKPNVYSTPKHMGTILNSASQETTPWISRNKRRLYFSSDREGTLGGNDLYYSDRIDYTWLNWKEPQALEAPFNSEFDDSQPFIDEVNSFLYFTSKRDGSSDIFRVSLKPIPKLEKPIKIYGQIRNKNTNKPMQAELLYGPTSAKGYLEYFSTRTGFFEIVIEDEETYKFYPFKRKFNAQRINFDVTAALKSGKLEHQLILYLDPTEEMVAISDTAVLEPESQVSLSEPQSQLPPNETLKAVEIFDFNDISMSDLKVGQRISFYDIRFVRSQATIMKRSTKALQSLYQTLIDFPQLEIAIEGHTDNVGDTEKNVDLSERRAKSVKDYLVRKGVNQERISIEGFGPHRPVASNNIESQRMKNRRVEIRILKKG